MVIGFILQHCYLCQTLMLPQLMGGFEGSPALVATEHLFVYVDSQVGVQAVFGAETFIT